tara:strand:+ start:2527 stop:3141 length:615 start_codon:yes stop_codon:yes gene_type:complete
MSATRRLALIALAMSGFLAFLVVQHASARANGTEIVLDVRGYDPRDVFLGHFSLIRTPLAHLDALTLGGEDAFAAGDEIFVSLEPDGAGGWQAVALHHERPRDGVFIRGYVRSSYELSGETRTAGPDDDAAGSAIADEIWIDSVFNIERYYASAAMARDLDLRLRASTPGDGSSMRLIISVSGNGDAIIKGFEVEGVRQIDRLW